MRLIDTARKTAFSEASIEEVNAIAFSDFGQIKAEETLIESFSQPFPLRERDEPVIDGGVDAYG